MTWAKLALVLAQLAAIFWRSLVSAKDQALGRAQATRDALEKQAEDNKQAVEAFNRAEKAHQDKPTSDDAFDPDFMRKEP